MQAVILAAGRGVRMLPLTKTTPKPLIKILGKSVLDHTFQALPESVDEVILVVDYLADVIKNHCGDSFFGKKIIYAQGSEKGTAHSFLSASKHIKNKRFLFIYGDEIVDKEDIRACLELESSILCWEVSDPWKHGVVSLDKDLRIKKIFEKPKISGKTLISDGVMVLKDNIFEYIADKGVNDEYHLTDMLDSYVQDNVVFSVITDNKVGSFTTPEDVSRIEQILSKKQI